MMICYIIIMTNTIINLINMELIPSQDTIILWVTIILSFHLRWTITILTIPDTTTTIITTDKSHVIPTLVILIVSPKNVIIVNLTKKVQLLVLRKVFVIYLTVIYLPHHFYLFLKRKVLNHLRHQKQQHQKWNQAKT